MINTSNGIYIRGVCVSTSAIMGKRKDGSGSFVTSREEIALQPGVAIFSRFYDSNDPNISISGDKVVKYPALKEFKTYEIKANRFKLNHEGQMVISDGLVTEVVENNK